MANPISLFWFTQLNQEVPNCYTPGQAQTRPTIRLSLSREGSVVALQSASSSPLVVLQSAPLPCNQPHCLAIIPIGLLTARLPCNQPHRLAISLTALLSVPSPCNQSHHLVTSLSALQSTSSPCCWPHHLAVVNKLSPIRGVSCIKAIFHWAEFSVRSDIFFCLKTNWRRVSVKKQKKISFHAENSAQWKMAFRAL